MSLFVAPLEAAQPLQPAGRSSEVVSLTFTPLAGEGVQELCRRLTNHLQEQSLAPLHLLAFGDCRAADLTAASLRICSGSADWPMTWAEGGNGNGRPLAGIQVHAFSGRVERLIAGGRIVGTVFNDGGARQCLIGGLLPANKNAPRAEQACQALESLQSILAQAGFDLADTVRTWFFLEDILSWYGEFNRARSEMYSRVKFRTGSLPASTGVGAKNPAGAALTLAAWAFKPTARNAFATEVSSPLQCPAPAYGSSFSRALEISTSAGRRLFISGTASIAPGGKTLWLGDVRQQVELTMDVVEAILRVRGLAFENIERATAYFRNPADMGVFAEWLAANNLSAWSVVSAQCDVCRDDLLFELEAEAKSAAGPREISAG
jgi:enamine deaminase RidA (YjgF/YER057c/UK114 family)